MQCDHTNTYCLCAVEDIERRTQQAERDRLKTELEQVKKERDAYDRAFWLAFDWVEALAPRTMDLDPIKQAIQAALKGQ